MHCDSRVQIYSTPTNDKFTDRVDMARSSNTKSLTINIVAMQRAAGRIKVQSFSSILLFDIAISLYCLLHSERWHQTIYCIQYNLCIKMRDYVYFQLEKSIH